MRKKQVLQLLTMLTATAAVCGGLFLRHQPMEVAAVRVEKGNICRTVGVAGTVCYTQETPVTAMVSGMVDALYVIEGERVTQGQALLFALEVFLFCVLGVTAVSLIVYAAYAVGFSFNKHKSALTAVSVLVFFQLVQFAAIAVLANLFCDGFTAWSSLTGVQAGNAIFAVALVCELIVCVIFYLVTYFFLTRKLNLE